MLKRGTRTCTRIYRGATQKRLLVRGSRAVFRDPEYALPALDHEIVDDAKGRWFEVSFIAPELLTGSAEGGWTWANGQHALDLVLESSADLVTWEMDGFEDAAGSPATVTGGERYTARAVIPVYWETTMIDLDLETDRAGKDLVGLTVFGSPVSLSFPYALPADAADLQADLRGAGYTDATVTVTVADLGVRIRMFPSGAILPVDYNGSGEVEQVYTPSISAPIPVSLPSYPYALPAGRAALQADLRAAGVSYAVVELTGDLIAIHLPDVAASGNNRAILAEIDPGDPYPTFDGLTGAYTGDVAGNAVSGSFSNVRTPSGDPLLERPRQFARLRITRSKP